MHGRAYVILGLGGKPGGCGMEPMCVTKLAILCRPATTFGEQVKKAIGQGKLPPNLDQWPQ